jgi:hypothetical protein
MGEAGEHRRAIAAGVVARAGELDVGEALAAERCHRSIKRADDDYDAPNVGRACRGHGSLHESDRPTMARGFGPPRRRLPTPAAGMTAVIGTPMDYREGGGPNRRWPPLGWSPRYAGGVLIVSNEAAIAGAPAPRDGPRQARM